jgi:hypothetical protein
MIETEKIETAHPVTFPAKAFAAQSATSGLTPHSIQRRAPGPQDVQIKILYGGVCHSDLHQVRNEWKSVMPTVFRLRFFFSSESILRTGGQRGIFHGDIAYQQFSSSIRTK